MSEYKKSRFNYYFEFENDNYVFNCLTGSLGQLDGQDIEIAKESQKDLLQNGFIVPTNKDEIQSMLDDVDYYTNTIRKELDITIVLTEMCNFRCVYCYQTKNVHVFSKEDADEFIDQAEELYNSGIERLNIHYFGGEPLLNYEILEYLDLNLKVLTCNLNKIYKSYITTNGSLLTLDIIKKIGFDTFYLTFDGNSYWQNQLKISPINSYENNFRLMNVILDNSASKINVRFNVCKENKDSFVEVLKRIVGLTNYSKDRVNFEISPLKKFKQNAKFTELSLEEYSRVNLKLRLAIQKTGVKLYLPRAIQEPCKYTTQNAYCIGPGMKGFFCTSDNRITNKKLNLKDSYFNKSYHHKLSDQCLKCGVLPLCIHTCGLLKTGDSACVVEKIILKDILCEYLKNPDEWR